MILPNMTMSSPSSEHPYSFDNIIIKSRVFPMASEALQDLARSFLSGLIF